MPAMQEANNPRTANARHEEDRPKQDDILLVLGEPNTTNVSFEREIQAEIQDCADSQGERCTQPWKDQTSHQAGEQSAAPFTLSPTYWTPELVPPSPQQSSITS